MTLAPNTPASERFGVHIYKEYLNFAAAHFLIFEDGTREEMHGHNYQVEVALDGRLGENSDIFIDFSHIKPIVKRICDAIDHRTLLPDSSRFLTVSRPTPDTVEAVYSTGDRWVFPARDVLILPLPNTSAERLAQYLCRLSLKELSVKYPDAVVDHVRFCVEESRGQTATYTLSESPGITLKQFAAQHADIEFPQSMPCPTK